MRAVSRFFDEMMGNGRVRPPYAPIVDWLDGEDPTRLAGKASEAEALFRRTGITFAVYGQAEAAERLIPFDMVPRVITGAEWDTLERGMRQRIQIGRAHV